jgi:hypothetical protein
MIDVFEKALARARDWPPEKQAEAAELLMALDELGMEPVELTEGELTAVDAALAEAERGDLADPAEVEALFARYRR